MKKTTANNIKINLVEKKSFYCVRRFTIDQIFQVRNLSVVTKRSFDQQEPWGISDVVVNSINFYDLFKSRDIKIRYTLCIALTGMDT